MKKRNAYIWVMQMLMWLAGGITAALMLFLLGYVLIKGLPSFGNPFRYPFHHLRPVRFSVLLPIHGLG